MKTFYIYECNSSICRGELFAVTEPPLSCPYCDSVVLDDPKFVTTNIRYDLYRKNNKI